MSFTAQQQVIATHLRAVVTCSAHGATMRRHGRHFSCRARTYRECLLMHFHGYTYQSAHAAHHAAPAPLPVGSLSIFAKHSDPWSNSSPSAPSLVCHHSLAVNRDIRLLYCKMAQMRRACAVYGASKLWRTGPAGPMQVPAAAIQLVRVPVWGCCGPES